MSVHLGVYLVSELYQEGGRTGYVPLHCTYPRVREAAAVAALSRQPRSAVRHALLAWLEGGWGAWRTTSLWGRRRI